MRKKSEKWIAINSGIRVKCGKMTNTYFFINEDHFKIHSLTLCTPKMHMYVIGQGQGIAELNWIEYLYYLLYKCSVHVGVTKTHRNNNTLKCTNIRVTFTGLSDLSRGQTADDSNIK